MNDEPALTSNQNAEATRSDRLIDSIGQWARSNPGMAAFVAVAVLALIAAATWWVVDHLRSRDEPKDKGGCDPEKYADCAEWRSQDASTSESEDPHTMRSPLLEDNNFPIRVRIPIEGDGDAAGAGDVFFLCNPKTKRCHSAAGARPCCTLLLLNLWREAQKAIEGAVNDPSGDRLWLTGDAAAAARDHGALTESVRQLDAGTTMGAEDLRAALQRVCDTRGPFALSTEKKSDAILLYTSDTNMNMLRIIPDQSVPTGMKAASLLGCRVYVEGFTEVSDPTEAGAVPSFSTWIQDPVKASAVRNADTQSEMVRQLIDAIYVVNLRFRPDRLWFVQMEFARLGLPIVAIDAITPRNTDVGAFKDTRSIMRDTAVACSLSHLDAMKAMVDPGGTERAAAIQVGPAPQRFKRRAEDSTRTGLAKQDPKWSFVIEDDACATADLGKSLERVLKDPAAPEQHVIRLGSVPKNCEILQADPKNPDLGSILVKRASPDSKVLAHTVGDTWGTWAMLYRRDIPAYDPFLRKIIQSYVPILLPADVSIFSATYDFRGSRMHNVVESREGSEFDGRFTWVRHASVVTTLPDLTPADPKGREVSANTSDGPKTGATATETSFPDWSGMEMARFDLPFWRFGIVSEMTMYVWQHSASDGDTTTKNFSTWQIQGIDTDKACQSLASKKQVNLAWMIMRRISYTAASLGCRVRPKGEVLTSWRMHGDLAPWTQRVELLIVPAGHLDRKDLEEIRKDMKDVLSGVRCAEPKDASGEEGAEERRQTCATPLGDGSEDERIDATEMADGTLSVHCKGVTVFVDAGLYRPATRRTSKQHERFSAAMALVAEWRDTTFQGVPLSVPRFSKDVDALVVAASGEHSLNFIQTCDGQEVAAVPCDRKS